MTNSDNDSDNSEVNYRKSRRKKSSKKERGSEAVHEAAPQSPPKPAPEPVEEQPIVDEQKPVRVSDLVKEQEDESLLGDVNPLMVGGTLLLAVGAAVCGGFLAMRNAAN